MLPGAQKTVAKQMNSNLLLSDDAIVDSKPQLEIFAVDVKCGPEVRNFDQIKKGDQLTMKYYQSVALALRKTDEPPSVEEKRSMTRSEPGQKPGGMAVKTVLVNGVASASGSSAFMPCSAKSR